MRVIDPGHFYPVENYDGDGEQEVVFMKREGQGYPGNVGHHPGTDCQELLRVLVDRVKYLDNQIPCLENQVILANLRSALAAFEIRAAHRHGRDIRGPFPIIEHVDTCPECGHVECPGHG